MPFPSRPLIGYTPAVDGSRGRGDFRNEPRKSDEIAENAEKNLAVSARVLACPQESTPCLASPRRCPQKEKQDFLETV